MSVWLQCVLSKLFGPRSGRPAALQIAITLLFVILLAWAGSHWLHTFKRVTRFYNPLPVEDYWRVPEQLQDYQRFNLRALWRQHNEHRIVFPELFFAADMLLFHGKQFLPLAVSFLFYIGCWILLVIASNSDRCISKTTRRFAAVLSAIIIGWPGIAFVLSAPFLFQWILMEFATCFSLVFLWRHKESAQNLHLWVAILAAIVATYSSANALLLWPVLVAAGILLQFPRRSMVILATSGFFSIVLYFVGYQVRGTLHLGAVLRHPIYTFEFLCAFLSMPLFPTRSIVSTLAAGIICIASSCYFFWLAKRKNALQSCLAVLYFGFFATVVLTGLLIAAGRMNPFDEKFSAAKQGRYLGMPLLNWGFFAAAALWIADRVRSKALRAVNIALVAAILFFLVSHAARNWARSHDSFKANEQLATLNVENGIPDIELTRKIFPNLVYIRRFAPLLQKNHLSIYYDGPAEWLGTPITGFMNDLGPTQKGDVTFTFPVQGGIELAGTANIPPHTSLTDPQIVFSNAKGEIVGFGRHLRAGVPEQLANAWPPAPLQWVAFINFRFDSHGIRAYLVSGLKLFPLDMQIPIGS